MKTYRIFFITGGYTEVTLTLAQIASKYGDTIKKIELLDL